MRDCENAVRKSETTNSSLFEAERLWRSVGAHHFGESTMLTEREVLESCLCNKVRSAARRVTNAYDAALRPVGLHATQFAILAAIGIRGSASITELARFLHLDRTTLSRNLVPLERAALIFVRNGSSGRSRAIEITDQGDSRLREALPYWKGAQAALHAELGDERWAIVSDGLDYLINPFGSAYHDAIASVV